MSEWFWMVLIVVLAILLVLSLYREKLKSFFFEGGGVKTGIETHKPPTTSKPAKTAPATAPPAAPVGAKLEVGNVENSQVYNAGADSDAHLTAKDIKGSTVINTRGDISVPPQS